MQTMVIVIVTIIHDIAPNLSPKAKYPITIAVIEKERDTIGAITIPSDIEITFFRRKRAIIGSPGSAKYRMAAMTPQVAVSPSMAQHIARSI